MALDPLQIVNEVSRLANSASVSSLRRLDTNAHIVATISLLHSALGGGTSSGGGISTEIDDSLDIESIKTSLGSILAELVNSKGIAEQWVQDSSPTPVKMLRRVSVDQTTGDVTITYVDGSPAQNAVTPVLPVTPIGVSRAALTPVTYQLNNGATAFDGYLDELSTPTALYADLLRQTQVTIGSSPANALGTSIKAVDPGLKTSRLADVRDGIDASADVGTIIAALNAIKGSTDLIDVAGGINNSTDINVIIAELTTIKTALGGTRQFSRQWVETAAGVPLLEISDVGAGGNVINTSYFGLTGNNTIGPQQFPTGNIKPLQSGRLALPAQFFGDAESDSAVLKRQARLQFPGGVADSSGVVATASGLTQVLSLLIGTQQRIVITELLVQSNSSTPVTAILKSIGTTTTSIRRYRLAGDGAGVNNIYTPDTRIKGGWGDGTISIDLSAPANVYCQLQYFVENINGLSSSP